MLKRYKAAYLFIYIGSANKTFRSKRICGSAGTDLLKELSGMLGEKCVKNGIKPLRQVLKNKSSKANVESCLYGTDEGHSRPHKRFTDHGRLLIKIKPVYRNVSEENYYEILVPQTR